MTTTMAGGAYADEVGYPPARVGWTAVGVLLLLYALAFVDRQIISLMVGDLKAEFGVSDLQIGLLQGFAFALLYALFGLPLGLAADRLPRRRVICFGVLVWALAAMACGMAQTFPQLLAARTLVGAGEAALAPAAYSMLGDLFPRRRLTLALSIYAIGAIMGSEISYALGGLILGGNADGVTVPVLGHLETWRFAFLVTGAPGLVLAFLVFVIPEPVRRGATDGVKATWSDVLAFMRGQGAFFACHLVGFASVMGLAYARLAWTPTFLIRRFDWTIEQAGVVLGLFGMVAGIIAFLISGSTVDALFRKGVRDAHFRFYVVGSVLLLVVGSLSFLAPVEWLFFAGIGLCAIWLGMAGAAASAIQLVTPPPLRGRVSAIYLLVTALLAMTVGPSLVGLLTDRVFQDPAKIHLALATTFLLLTPVALTAFVLGLKPMRRAVEAAEAA